jgi:hypothetical protein
MTASQRALRSLPAAAAALLLLSTALLVLGVVLENRGEPATSSAPGSTPSGSTSQPIEQGEPEAHQESGAHEEPGHQGDNADTHASDAASGETVLGVPIESPGAVAAAVIVSVALAVLVWRRPNRPVTTVVALAAAGAVVLDLAEVGHQISENRDGLAAFAALVATGHLAVVIAAAIMWRRATSGHHQTQPDAATG